MADEQIVRFDRNRASRIGLEEAVLAQSKTPDRIAAIVDEAVAEERRLFITRIGRQCWEAQPSRIQQILDYDSLSRTAVLGEMPSPQELPSIAIVTAGTADARVAAEARRTLEYSGYAVDVISDVGVAGLWRLLEHVERLEAMPIKLVFAGMDAALPSVVAGLVSGSIIAVPTSVGYGVADGGRVALDSALSSCAPGVTVVNIDNGYGAACAAIRILDSRP